MALTVTLSARSTTVVFSFFSASEHESVQMLASEARFEKLIRADWTVKGVESSVVGPMPAATRSATSIVRLNETLMSSSTQPMKQIECWYR